MKRDTQNNVNCKIVVDRCSIREYRVNVAAAATMQIMPAFKLLFNASIKEMATEKNNRIFAFDFFCVLYARNIWKSLPTQETFGTTFESEQFSTIKSNRKWTCIQLEHYLTRCENSIEKDVFLVSLDAWFQYLFTIFQSDRLIGWNCGGCARVNSIQHTLEHNVRVIDVLNQLTVYHQVLSNRLMRMFLGRRW